MFLGIHDLAELGQLGTKDGGIWIDRQNFFEERDAPALTHWYKCYRPYRTRLDPFLGQCWPSIQGMLFP